MRSPPSGSASSSRIGRWVIGKGRIVIEDACDGEFTLSRRDGDRRQRKAFGDTLPPGERAVHGALFADGRDSVSFGTQYEPVMGAASTALLTAFNWEYGRAYFRRNSGFWLLGALIVIERRIGIGRRVAAAKGDASGPFLRPGREAQILRRLAGKLDGADLPVPVMERVWR